MKRECANGYLLGKVAGGGGVVEGVDTYFCLFIFALKNS